MSIRYIPNAPLPAMTKATISLWFKHSAGDAAVEPWDWGSYPPPPDKSKGLVSTPPIPPGGAFVFYDPYGDTPASIIPIRGVEPMIYPFPPVLSQAAGPPVTITPPPPDGTDGSKPPDGTGGSKPPAPVESRVVGHPVDRIARDGSPPPDGTPPGNGGDHGGKPPAPTSDSPAVLSHDKYNFMVTFGDPAQAYNYRPWIAKKINTFSGVLEIGAPFVYADYPPPYRPYWMVVPSGPNKGQPLGAKGLLDVYNMQLADAPTPVQGIVPPAFIGVNGSGQIRVLLQTKTRANYKGYFWTQTAAKAMFAQSTIYRPPVWGYIGPYWAGWQFTYKDNSGPLMAAAPEFFMLTGPQVVDGWNHLLVSWDISGSVSVTSKEPWVSTSGGPVTVTCTTGCKAWMALNGVVYPGDNIQDPPGLPEPPKNYFPSDVSTLPHFTWSRSDLGLKPNEIIPQNAFLRLQNGVPRDNIPRVYAADNGSDGPGYTDALSGLHYLSFLGLGGGIGKVDKTTVPDPKKFIEPVYTCPNFTLPAGTFDFGVPATLPVATNHNAGHIMAELNVWAGKATQISVDTLKAFIDDNNKPTKVPDMQKVMGRPHIQLHLTSHWQKGHNTGSIGSVTVGGQEQIIDRGQFVVSGVIDPYKPDPKIGS